MNNNPVFEYKQICVIIISKLFSSRQSTEIKKHARLAKDQKNNVETNKKLKLRKNEKRRRNKNDLKVKLLSSLSFKFQIQSIDRYDSQGWQDFDNDVMSSSANQNGTKNTHRQRNETRVKRRNGR